MPKRAPPGIIIDAIVRSIMNVRLRWILQSTEITIEVHEHFILDGLFYL